MTLVSDYVSDLTVVLTFCWSDLLSPLSLVIGFNPLQHLPESDPSSEPALLKPLVKLPWDSTLLRLVPTPSAWVLPWHSCSWHMCQQPSPAWSLDIGEVMHSSSTSRRKSHNFQLTSSLICWNMQNSLLSLTLTAVTAVSLIMPSPVSCVLYLIMLWKQMASPGYLETGIRCRLELDNPVSVCGDWQRTGQWRQLIALANKAKILLYLRQTAITANF